MGLLLGRRCGSWLCGPGFGSGVGCVTVGGALGQASRVRSGWSRGGVDRVGSGGVRVFAL